LGYFDHDAPEFLKMVARPGRNIRVHRTEIGATKQSSEIGGASSVIATSRTQFRGESKAFL
jgi:hypothetical protein